MKDWTETQRAFIRAHLNIDMTAGEIARLFMVADADIYQAVRLAARFPGYNHSSPLGFHSPGGGCLLARLGVKGATIADEYQPMEHDEFQRLYRPEGWVRPL